MYCFTQEAIPARDLARCTCDDQCALPGGRARVLRLMACLSHAEKRAGIRVQPVFITVDPERDTAKQIQSYIKEFHPRMIGLRGTMEEVKKAAKLFRVYFMKTNDSKDYLVDHSIIMVRLRALFVSPPGLSRCTPPLQRTTAVRHPCTHQRSPALLLLGVGLVGPGQRGLLRVQYLLNPEGKFVTFYGKSFTAEEIASNLVQHARAWKDKHPDYKLRL